MRPLTSLERFLERLFEQPSARLFRTRLQPIQLQRRIERAMELERLSGNDRILVPNRFRVRLSPSDMAAFADVASSLAAELADGALAFARAHRYAVSDRPQVQLVADDAIAPGQVKVDTRFADPDSRLDQGGPPAAERPDPRSVTRTMVFRAPVVDSPLAVLREFRPDGTQREVTVDGRLLTIGRARDNGLVLTDSRASRHHARLQGRRGTLVLTDLGSTNGSRVNGVSVDEVVLGEGDRIEIGDTILVVESVGEG
jgi:FHA domain-containing protein